MRAVAAVTGRSFAVIGLAAIGALLVGCAHQTTLTAAQGRTTASAGNYAAYVESVFRYENRVGDEMIGHAESARDSGSAIDPGFVTAEARLNEDCRYLNEAAALSADRRALPFALQLKVMHTVAACEQAARQAALMLDGGAEAVAATLSR